MILLCGIPSEVPLALLQSHLERLGATVVSFNQRRSPWAEFGFGVSPSGVRGCLTVDGQVIRLEDVRGVYTRMMDEQLIPEFKDEPKGSAARQRAQDVCIGLVTWMEIAPARVVNRASDMASNGSKPYQSQLIRQHGFALPQTLITNRPEEAIDFRERLGRVVYKSITEVRHFGPFWRGRSQSRQALGDVLREGL
jgi:hypothetical protein